MHALAREILHRPALLAGLSLLAIILGIVILFLAQLPPAIDRQATQAPRTEMVTVTPSRIASPATSFVTSTAEGAPRRDGQDDPKSHILSGDVY